MWYYIWANILYVKILKAIKPSTPACVNCMDCSSSHFTDLFAPHCVGAFQGNVNLKNLHPD